MSLDQSIVGRAFPPTTPYDVGREKIREFADAIGDLNPVFRDPDAAKQLGYRDVIAPPTFPIVLTMHASEQVLATLGIELRNVLHREQRFDNRRPVVAGDRLVCRVTLDSLKSVAGNSILVIKAAVTTESGEDVAVAWSTLVVRGDDA